MMKLGILTYHSAHNYGAILQAYGLQRELQRLGYEPVCVHFHPNRLEAKNRYRRPVRSFKDLAVAVAHGAFRRPLHRRYERFEAFRHEYLHTTRHYPDFATLCADPPDVDAYICGSDQIWNVSEGASPAYFLRFTDSGISAIAYAPSFGTSPKQESLPPDLGEWISRFQHLSARESSGVELIRLLTGREAPQVLDPAFFLSGAEWSGVAVDSDIEEPYLLFYALESSAAISRLVSALADALSLPIVVAGKGGTFVFRKGTRLAIDSGPREFLGLVQNAAFVLSNSFHATVFAILFKRPFYTIGHSTRNARMESLLTMAGLTERLITDPGRFELPKDLIDDDSNAADYARIEIELEKSRAFLRSALTKTSAETSQPTPHYV